MFNLFKTNQFKRNFKKNMLSDKNDMAYIDVVYKLLNNIKLDKKYQDHLLKGNKKNYRECHIKPDLLLIYRIDNSVLKLIDIGSHAELFE